MSRGIRTFYGKLDLLTACCKRASSRRRESVSLIDERDSPIENNTLVRVRPLTESERRSSQRTHSSPLESPPRDAESNHVPPLAPPTLTPRHSESTSLLRTSSPAATQHGDHRSSSAVSSSVPQMPVFNLLARSAVTSYRPRGG